MIQQQNRQPKTERKRKREKHAKKQLRQNLQRAEHLLEAEGYQDEAQIAAVLAQARLATTAQEALETNLILERILLRENSMLEDPNRRGELQRTRADAASRDKASEAFSRDKDGFIMDVLNRSESLIQTGSRAEKTQAMAVQMKTKALHSAKAKRLSKQLELDWDINHGPKMDINATGQWLNIGPTTSSRLTLVPEEIHIMHRVWVLQPGFNKDVPKIFADRYEQILRSRSETAEREKAMGASQNMDGVAGMEFHALERKLSEIDRSYNSRRQTPEGNR